jgi:poly-beta-1,6-N-acetyl-D-glucosamine N-deacetylase
MSVHTGAGQGNLAGAPGAHMARPGGPGTEVVRQQGRPRIRWYRRLAAAAVALLVVGILAAAGYAFVLKSMPYQTPQLPAPRVALTASQAASFVTYRPGLPEVPVLAWRDVSHRVGHLATTPARFATQLAALRRNGYHSVSLGTVAALAAGKRVPLPARPVLLTFDDGLSIDWTTVDPILRRYGFTAVVFVNPADVALKSPSYFLTADELNAMVNSGRWGVGVELPGIWRSQAAAVRAAIAGRGVLETYSGHPVTAFAWPTLDSSSKFAQRQPEAFYTMLRRHFAAVFAPPQEGAASFVVKERGRPLPRLTVAAADTLRSLSLRLRTGVQSPPPADPLTLPWLGAGGHCTVSRAGVVLTTQRFALCTVAANGARWRDYALRGAITARRGVTAIIEVRSSTAGCLEVAVGTSLVSIKQRVGRDWSVLREARMPAVKAGGHARSLLGGRALPVEVRVSGRLLAVRAGPLTIRHLVSPRVASGVISLGVVAGHKRATVAYDRLTVITPS